MLFGSIKNGMKKKITFWNPLKLEIVCFRVPYDALARTFEEIENISARLKIIEILSNYFRSVIVLTPEDLLPSIYLCLNKLGPAYEGNSLIQH